MRIAYTISAYRLFNFIKLGVLQLRRLDPEAPILISDDPGPESPGIEQFAKDHGCVYLGARERRGHFGGDFQSLVNAVEFAEANECQVGMKISQRFVFRKIEGLDAFRKSFSDPALMAATPGRPSVTTAHTRDTHGFGAFGTLSDVVAIRVGGISGDGLVQLYRARLHREKVPWASFIECLVDELHSNVFPGRTVKLPEWTNPTEDAIYLRRYQANEKQYRELAKTHGFDGQFPLHEWAYLERSGYLCKPVVI